MTTLGECCFSIEDGDWIETKDQGEQGYRLLQISNIGLGQFRETGNYRWVTPETFQRLRCNEIRIGDVLVARMPEPTGRCWYVDNLPWPAITAVDVAIVRTNPELLDPLYCSYFLNSPQTLAEVSALTVGTTRTRIKRTDLASLEIALPSLPIQKSIAALLRVFDDRITLLRETNVTLEAIAQALFKSWFVDFDPVRAKMEGRAPQGMDEATAALFPDSFEETELGLVPRGWMPRTFRETIDIIGGGTPKTSNPDFWNGNIPWFSVVDAPAATDVFVIDTEKHITEAGLNGSSTKLLPAGTTIISARGTVGRLALTGCPMAMNQSCYGLRGAAGDDYFTFFSTTRLVQQLQQKAHGSVFDTITQETFSGVHLNYPNAEVITAFDSAVEPLMLRIRQNLIQAQSLSILRDTLLPRLISGQLRLLEAHAVVEACDAL